MGEAARDRIEEEFRQEAMDEGHFQMLWRDWTEADAHARRTRTISDLRFAQKAYYRLMRASLTDPERRVLELEDELRGVKAELARVRAETGLHQRGRVPSWKDGEGSQKLPPPLPPQRSGEP